MVKKGDYVKIDTSKLKDTMPPYVKLVRQTIKKGHGKVYVADIKGDYAEVAESPQAAMILGTVRVPTTSLKESVDNGFRLAIRKMVEQELENLGIGDEQNEECEDDEELEETTQTGDVAGYQTPAAFTGKVGKERKNKWHNMVTRRLGYETVWDEEDADELGPDAKKRSNYVGKNESIIKENKNYFISVVQKDKIIKVVGKENNETKANNLAKKIRPKYDIDKYDIIIQPSDIEKENDYKEWFNESVKLNEEKKSQIHLVSPHKVELVDMKTKKVLATNFKSEAEARKYGEERGWFVSQVSVRENVKESLKLNEANGHDVELFWKGLSGKDAKIGRFVVSPKTYDNIDTLFGNHLSIDLYDDKVSGKQIPFKDVVNAMKNTKYGKISMKKIGIHEATDETAKIYVGGDPYWLRKMGDTTHFHMANSEKGIKTGGWVYHIGQHRDEEYYNDIVKWLKGQGKINGKKYKKFFRQQENINEEVSQQAKDDVVTLLKSYNGEKVPDEKIHAIADKHSISPHDLESYIYSLASAHVNESLTEGRRGAYHEFRDDESMTTRQKIGESLRNVRNQLVEIEKTVDLNLRLKQETGIDSQQYWRRTHRALNKINEKMTRIINKIRRF